MNIYKNKKNLLVLMGLFSFSMQSIDASQYSKKIGMSLVAAAKVLASDRSAMQTAYPENDTHNHNIMNGTYFDKRPFINNAEKRNFIKHHFKHMNVQTDMNKICVDLLMRDSFSRQNLVNFMHIAQQAARDKKSDSIKLIDIERAFIEIEYGINNKQHSYDIKKTAYHEAGHAVLSSILDMGSILIWASIQPSNTYKGYVYNYAYMNEFNNMRISNRIYMAFAGGITEQVFGIPDKFEFDTEDNIIADFHSRGTKHDFLIVSDLIKELVFRKIEKDRQNCILSGYKFIGFGEDNFIAIYDQCTILHCSQEAINNNRGDLAKAHYFSTIQLIRNLQPEIEAVAQELLQEKVISGKRINQIIHEVQSLKNNKKFS